MPFDFRRFDIYRKVPKDLTQPTYTGAIISVCCCLFILFLFLSELTGFIATEIVNELYVDDPDKDSGGKIEVNLNISLPNLHCELVGLDIQDEMGRHEVGHIDNSMKIPLNNGDGCRFEGHFSINKVPGNFHVSTHSATAQPQNPDMTHVIHKLSFGDKLQRQAAILLPVHGGKQGVRSLQPHRPHHPSHLVPLRPEPHHSEIHREETAFVQVYHIDMCHHWRNIYCSWDPRLLHFHSIRGLEENPAGQNAVAVKLYPRLRGQEQRLRNLPLPVFVFIFYLIESIWVFF
uniref:Endoplasmic reticulum-Golgi intermediate compartment protein n=1 Tax=Taeniopygia guttata TaxID=59729 RepID=A0A674H3A2_TAEGU